MFEILLNVLQKVIGTTPRQRHVSNINGPWSIFVDFTGTLSIVDKYVYANDVKEVYLDKTDEIFLKKKFIIA